MPFVFYCITDTCTFPCGDKVKKNGVMVIWACMFVPKVWNHLDATYCDFSLIIAKEKYKSTKDSKLYSHVAFAFHNVAKWLCFRKMYRCGKFESPPWMMPDASLSIISAFFRKVHASFEWWWLDDDDDDDDDFFSKSCMIEWNLTHQQRKNWNAAFHLEFQYTRKIKSFKPKKCPMASHRQTHA
jgi:hypothetical protein